MSPSQSAGTAGRTASLRSDEPTQVCFGERETGEALERLVLTRGERLEDLRRETVLLDDDALSDTRLRSGCG